MNVEDGGGPVQDILKTVKELWAAFVVPIALALHFVWREARDGNAKRRTADNDAEARRRSDAIAQAASNQARDVASFDWLQSLIKTQDNDLKEARLEAIELRRDRDRGWDLARYWHGMAHDLFHARNSARTIAEYAASKTIPITIEPWTGPTRLPEFDAKQI